MAPVAESPFVGRDLEWNQLIQAWNTAREGGAHLLLVTGEPGIGKSRLALELARRVRAEGHVVASARAYEAAGKLPWGPVVDLLRSDALRSHVDTLDTVWRAELARLLPELLDAPQPSGPSQSGDPAQRHRLFDAVSRAILAGERPRLLIIDDLQWCDAETIKLIGFVVRSGQTAPVLIVGTARWEEIPQHHPLVGLVDALGHDQAVTIVPLNRFDEATTATLAARPRAVDAIDPKLAARLWSETEGDPLFVIEALRAGISPDGSQAVLTPTMRTVLRARLGQLTDGARRLAEVAAVIGRPFSVALMVSATGTDDHPRSGAHVRFQSRQASGGCPGDGQSSSSTSIPPGRRRGDRGRVPPRHRHGQPTAGRTLRPGRHGRTRHQCLPHGGGPSGGRVGP